MFAGFYGGVTDSILSRITDIFFGIPLVLGGILLLASFPSGPDTPKWQTMGKVSVVLAILGWTSLARITRSTVIQVKQADYVNAARALGGDAKRILRLHVLPNALAPVIVYATIVLGIFIFMTQWTNFLWPLVIITNDEMRTLTVGVASLEGQFVTNWGVIAAGSLMTMVPITIVFLIFQRWFVRASMAGALKG